MLGRLLGDKEMTSEIFKLFDFINPRVLGGQRGGKAAMRDLYLAFLFELNLVSVPVAWQPVHTTSETEHTTHHTGSNYSATLTPDVITWQPAVVVCLVRLQLSALCL